MSPCSPCKLPQITNPPGVTSAVLHLLEICHQLYEEIQALYDESARLKGGSPKPPIKPSTLESTEQGADKQKSNHRGKHRGKHKRCKTQDLGIHEEIVIAPKMPPPHRQPVQGL